MQVKGRGGEGRRQDVGVLVSNRKKGRGASSTLADRIDGTIVVTMRQKTRTERQRDRDKCV